MKERLNNWAYFAPGTFTAVLIAVLSTRGNVRMPVDLVSVDKVGHFAAYMVLALAFFWGTKKAGWLTQPISWLIVILCAVYGVALEIIQFAFFPDRFFELLDIVANICGALAGKYAFRFIVNKTF